MIKFSLFYSFFGLFSRRNRGVAHYFRGAVLGIGLSLIPLIVVLEVTDGMIEGITARYLELGTYHIQAFVNDGVGINALKKLALRIEGIKGVRIAIPEKRGVGILYFKGRRDAVTVRAIIPDVYRRDTGFRKYFKVLKGRFDLTDESGIIVSRVVAEKLKLKCGDTLRLLTLSGGIGKNQIPKVRSFRLKAIFTTGYEDLDKMLVYIPLEVGFKLLGAGNSYEIVGIKTYNPFGSLEKIMKNISRLLPMGSYLYTWYQLEISQYKSFQTTKALLLFVMALIVIVATMNISSSMIMTILEKEKEIAILKCMGASPWMITLSFAFMGLLGGMLGSFLGIISGIFISVNVNQLFSVAQLVADGIVDFLNGIYALFGSGTLLSHITIFNNAYYLNKIPVHLRFTDIVVVGIITVSFSTLASLIPALRAGRLKPIELINRY